MNQKRSMKNRQPYWIAAIFMLAPLGLGAKGCDRAVVGNEDECPDGPDQCEAGGSAGSSGSAGNSGAPSSGGTSTTGGTAGNSGAPSSGGTSTAGSAGTGTSGTSSTTACGGLLGSACAENEYCHYSPGTMCGNAIDDQTGICRMMPQACDANLLPVCGCDDRTYGNACEAAMAGVSVAREGECEATGVACGARAGDTCAEDEYCAFPPELMCGIADGEGTCQPRPEVCEDEYDPVCGCDGMTYGNSCEAAGAGTGVFSMGECETDPGFCGGIAGFGCDEGEFCNYPIETMCGQGHMAGSCEPIPELCTQEYAPVCGCDGVTYSNECFAKGAGTSVASGGECETDPGFCGGIAGFACPEGEYCAYPIEAMCGAADQGGTCAWMPEVCTADVDPVCGCDGKTYSNACMAAGAGISVQAEGECPTR